MFFRKKNKETAQIERLPVSAGVFSTDLLASKSSFADRMKRISAAYSLSFQKPAPIPSDSSGNALSGIAMDGMESSYSINSMMRGVMSDDLISWYGSQGFIGYQLCAMIAQNWLVDKACTLPARDAVRNGYDIGADDGVEVEPKILSEIKKLNKKYDIDEQMVEFSRNNRIFGIRIAMFKVESSDPLYYEKPFNPDGIKPNSYRGISQIDPYWITPELDFLSATDPASMDFYEPTYWRVNGKRYHKSHLIIIRLTEVADVLKPSYMFGGISLPQKIYERVYASERTANEGPMLAMTKRLNTLVMDLENGIMDQESFMEKMKAWAAIRDNYGTRVIGTGETIQQFDTSLADLDSVIMTQYQLVAAIANIPATKLLGTQPKGFNSSGEYEESAYHEELESIQTHELQPLIDRHHLLLMRSEIAPKFGVNFDIVTSWNELDSPTKKEQAEINYINAQTDSLHTQNGALDGRDVRMRLISDKDSGYNGLSAEPEVNLDDELTDLDAPQNEEALNA